MPFSIENMLQLREFKDCTVIAGHKGINRVIQCVDTMEVPDITPWLQCGELLITTGYSLEGHLERLIPLLDAMYNNDSAGLMYYWAHTSNDHRLCRFKGHTSYRNTR